MSRFFNGGTAADFITFAVGNAPPDQGPITIAVLAHPSTSSFTGWTVQGMTAGGVWSILADSSVLFIENDFTSGGPAHGTGWCWYVATKASGSAVPRWHMHDLTAGTAWTHANSSGTVADNTGPITSIRVGSSAAGSAAQTFRGRIAAVAAWTSALGDVAVEAACTTAAADLAAAAPNWGVLLNQASTATSVTDFTGGGGDQTALTGTAVDGDEPPGWSYTLTATATDGGGYVEPMYGPGVGPNPALSFVDNLWYDTSAVTAAALLDVAGAAIATPTAAGALTLAGALTGGASTTPAASGSLGLVSPITGTATATPAAAGVLGTVLPLAGAASVTPAAAGALAQTMAVSGSATAAPAAAGSLTRVTPISGSVSTTPVAAGTLTITSGPSTFPISGSASATPAATGGLTLQGALSGTATVTPGAAGSLTARMALTGAATASPAAVGALTLRITITGSASAVAAALGSLTIIGPIAPITVRPFTGTTSRPGTGTTARPFTGTTARP